MNKVVVYGLAGYMVIVSASALANHQPPQVHQDHTEDEHYPQIGRARPTAATTASSIGQGSAVYWSF